MSWETVISRVQAEDEKAAAVTASEVVVQSGYEVARVKRVRYMGDGRWNVTIVLAETPNLPSIVVIPARSDA